MQQPSPTTRSNLLARSKTSPAETSLSRNVKESVPQLSERETIFATNYRFSDGDTPLTSPQQDRKESAKDRAGLIAQALHRHQLQEQERDTNAEQSWRDRDRQSMAAASSLSPVPATMTDLSAVFQTLPQTDLHHLSHPHPSSRHSLYHHDQFETALNPPTTPAHNSDPSTDSSIANLQSSAHRSSYRAWRQGQGRMAGKSIAESQGITKHSGAEENDVECKIDAKMPKIDQGINVRSRKTSHFLGLFKEHDSEHEKKRDKKEREKDQHKEEGQAEDQQSLPAVDEVDGQSAAGMRYLQIPQNPPLTPAVPPSSENDVQQPSNESAVDPEQPPVPLPVASSFEEEAEQKPLTTDNAEGRIAHQIPPSLLEEIRNHHIILGPNGAKAPSDQVPVNETFEKVRLSISRKLTFSPDFCRSPRVTQPLAPHC